jgi:uncharacterized protein (TIGR00297 family)
MPFHLLLAYMPAFAVRSALGLLAAAAIALAARRAGSLSASGAVAATVVGTAAVTAGWGWGALLVLYFALSSALSHAGAAEKRTRTGGVVAKGGARDAAQVLANGGVFALCVLCLPLAGPQGRSLAAAAAGALAAAAADTWATEIGALFGGTPRALLGLRPVPPGTSGAMSLAGTGAMIAGALCVALAARALGLTDAFAAVTAAGCAGALADTLIGATMQERRWCDACGLATEQAMHDCGAPTRHAGGLAVLDNDAVNLVATVVGAATALLLAFGS